jgi:hypothetical protein
LLGLYFRLHDRYQGIHLVLDSGVFATLYALFHLISLINDPHETIHAAYLLVVGEESSQQMLLLHWMLMSAVNTKYTSLVFIDM